MKTGKFKPNKGLLKRIKVTAKGKVKVRKPGSGHLLSHKTGNRRRKLRRPLTAAPCEARRCARMLGLR